MFPPPPSQSIDLAALSGICGSISIACWVVVFSPQIIENFKRSSAEGLSIVFLVVWLLGDVFNILGAILQGVLPTMIILAVYYTLADVVLIAQCFYYRGFTLSDKVPCAAGSAAEQQQQAHDPERRPLLSAPASAHHLSPATPLHDPPRAAAVAAAAAAAPDGAPSSGAGAQPRTRLQAALFNTVAVLLVCAAGVAGWWLSSSGSRHHHAGTDDERDRRPADDAAVTFNLWGQIFGYLCAALYLGSRVPQLLLNYRRKSTEGVSLLFFLFACIGNLTYDMSIFAYDPTPLCRGQADAAAAAADKCAPGEAARIYATYIAVNASWIAGSLGTLLLDMCIFIQFFLYRTDE